ncbi:MAG: MBL fold metallo-hydrolase [Bacteroidales bacterium]|nr:MBL fold metallo-hydrolase [Bacteroidales bacterium]
MEKVTVDAETSIELQENTSCNIIRLIKGTSGHVFASSSLYIHDKNANLNILFDTSFPYNSKNLLDALKKLEIEPDQINYIILSHWHFDHCGSINFFKNATIIMSYETYRSIDYFDQAIKYSLSQEKPIDSLTNILFQKMNDHKRKAEFEPTINDNYKYFDNYSKVRAIANIIINNNNMYSQIIDKVNQGKFLIIENKTKNLSSNLILYNLNLHTEGDLILEIQNKNFSSFCVGDILEDNNSESYDSLIKDRFISDNDNQLIKHIFKPGNIIIKGHGNDCFINEMKRICNI